MGKTYQNEDASAIGIAVPDVVAVSMAEIAEDMREGLLALAVGAGLQVMQTLMARTWPRSPVRAAGTTVSVSRCGMALVRAR